MGLFSPSKMNERRSKRMIKNLIRQDEDISDMIKFILNAYTHIFCGFIKNIDIFIFTLVNILSLCYFDKIHYCQKVHTKAAYSYGLMGVFY